MENKAELLQYLRTNYFKKGHSLYYSGISKINFIFNGSLSIEEIENFLQRQDGYTGYKKISNNFFVYF